MEGWLATPIREEHLDVDGRELGAFFYEQLRDKIGKQLRREVDDWLTEGWRYFNRRIERTQARTGAYDGSVALPSPVHSWSGRVELCRNGCDDLLFTHLLMEGLGASQGSY